MESINAQKELNLSSENKEDLISLPFNIKKSCTSQDPLYPITNLKERDNSNNGWVSQNLCTYPQKIIIKFEKYVNIKQINLVINETKIPKIIQFINCIKISGNSILNKNKYKYQNIGYIRLSENIGNNYQSRESRKVLLNINKTNRVKLLIHENYQNSFNTQNQVGIVSLEFIGNYVNEDESNNNSNDNSHLFDMEKIDEKDNESSEEEEKYMEDKEEEKNQEENDKEKNKEENAEEVEIKKYHEIAINNAEKNEKENNENSKNNENNQSIENKVVITKRKSILKNGKNKMKEASTMTNLQINQNYKNNNGDIKDNEDNLYYNRNKYIQNKINNNIIFNSYDNNESFKEEKKDNKINLSNYKIENMIKEKFKKLNESNEKADKNPENVNQFIKLQNEINNLKKMLKKIYNINEFKVSEKNNELTPQNKYYFKFKTINDGRITAKSRNQKNNVMPLIRNKTVKYYERNQLRNASINLNKKFKISESPKGIISLKDLSSDNFVLLTIKNKFNKKNNYEDNKNNSSKSENSFNLSNDEGNEYLEELSPEIREENDLLINILGEEIIQKIYSKNIKYKEEGFNLLNLKVKDIIVFSPENINDTNDYIISLINIVFLFIDDKHSSIIMKCLELFINLIKSIEEKSELNKIEYDFKITKPLIKKIIEKFNNNSKRVREKVSELYYYMLDSNLCDYKSLIIELIEKDVNEYFYKLNSINNNNFSPRINFSSVVYGLSHQIDKYNIINQNSIMMKMNIFLKIFSDQEKLRKQLDRKKFPESIVEDYLIMNLNNSKEEEVLQITKKVLAKYINIFGNQIFYKLNLIIESKELLKKIQDNDELIYKMKKYKEERNKKDIKIKNMFNNYKLNKLIPLSPIGNRINHFNKKNTFIFEKIKMNQMQQKLMRVSSLPKLDNLKKMKLKPIKAGYYMNDLVNSIDNNTQNKELLCL